MDMQNVIKAAQAKFGVVTACIEKDTGEYFVAIKRDNAPCANRPFMTITAFTHYNNNKDMPMPEVSFCWGHYDLNKDYMNQAILYAEQDASKFAARH